MANIFIDNKAYDVNLQNNLLEAAIAQGLNLPYFCWHPALGSVGSCRQCAVQQFQDENDTQGRMVMACMTPLKEGARFSIAHPTCSDFRKNVIEWMMINHPHDCPVCDEGGECHLQDMTVMTGHNTRNYRFKKRTFKNQNLGPLVNHEMNRCITCYRCVRFYKDVAHGKDLSPFASSGKVYFGRNEDGVLESNFSGNLAEVCPTGVFTDKLFHAHHIRKWDLETAPSVCQLCSLGCNISPGERLGLLRRVQNRYNHDINGYFICDKGRFGHEFVNSKQRAIKPKINGIEADINEVYAKIKVLLQQKGTIAGIGSPRASLESNWLLKKIVGENNFYSPDLDELSLATKAAQACLVKNHNALASLKDIREADALLIIGEDLENTAPMMALSVKQARSNFGAQKALNEQNISTWNDTAIKDYVRDKSLPIHIVNIASTSLDEIGIFHLAPFTELAKVAETIAQKFIACKNPVIISGTSLASKELINKVGAIFENLHKHNPNAKIALALNEANSLGFSLLGPKNISSLPKNIDLAFVLENDLIQRLGSFAEEIFSNVKNLVALDYLETKTIQKAHFVLPVLSFAECSASLINNEGRLQRYFSVFKNNLEFIKSSWRMLMPFSSFSFNNIDEVCEEIAKDLSIPNQLFKDLYGASFTILGNKIPRQTSECSGRTAINAKRNIHEQKPPMDPDSPFSYSMEGARVKIPLPLISSSWQPSWNSVQSSFIKTLQIRNDEQLKAKETKVLSFIKNSANNSANNFQISTPNLPSVLVMPKFHIYGSEERSAYAKGVDELIPKSFAYLSEEDAKKLGLTHGQNIQIEKNKKYFTFPLRIEKEIAKGILLLPFGLTDSSLLFSEAIIKNVLNKEAL